MYGFYCVFLKKVFFSLNMLCQGPQDHPLGDKTQKSGWLLQSIAKRQFKISECKRHIRESSEKQVQASRCPL